MSFKNAIIAVGMGFLFVIVLSALAIDALNFMTGQPDQRMHGTFAPTAARSVRGGSAE
jgi:hypothetical protein